VTFTTPTTPTPADAPVASAGWDAASPTSTPSGLDDLEVRERWLRQRRARSLSERHFGLITLWVAVVAAVCWLFVAGFAGLGH
jgi:hypothetical protein